MTNDPKLATDEQGHYVTTEENNLRARVLFLEGLLQKTYSYLCTGKSIESGSEAHGEIFIALGHGPDEWKDHPCPWLPDETDDDPNEIRWCRNHTVKTVSTQEIHHEHWGTIRWLNVEFTSGEKLSVPMHPHGAIATPCDPSEDRTFPSMPCGQVARTIPRKCPHCNNGFTFEEPKESNAQPDAD